MIKIIQAPAEVLSKPVTDLSQKEINSDLHKLIKDMEVALVHASDPKGVGLAAPQVGKSIAMYITKPTERSRVNVFINPKIISMEDLPSKKTKKRKSDKKLEGCLSLKDIWGEVKRADIVEMEYIDEKGVSHTKKLKGFMATIAQHEVDHLNGILFPKRVLEQQGQLYHSTKDEEDELIFEPIEI